MKRTLATLITLMMTLASCQFVTTFEGTDPDGSGPAPQQAFDLSDFEFHLDHRDSHIVSETSWQGEHAFISGDGRDGATDCTGPDQTHTITRGTDPTYNDEWYYVCDSVNGNTAAAHLMTAIGDTSGYSIGSFTPAQTFTDVTKVNWDVNITDLGARQWVEVKILPVDDYDPDNPPCGVDWLAASACGNDGIPADGVAAVFFNHEPSINVGGVLNKHWAQWGGPWLNPGDPALTSTMIRRQHFLEDNGDGTLTFGIQQPDGSFFEYSTAGSFPDGDVRVVFADHNYTPHKDNEMGDCIAALGHGRCHTWHWDNIAVS